MATCDNSVTAQQIDMFKDNMSYVETWVESDNNTEITPGGKARYTPKGLEELVRDITSPATKWWLAPAATDPTTGWSGVPLEAGMIYLNTAATPPLLRYYNGDDWGDLLPTNVILW